MKFSLAIFLVAVLSTAAHAQVRHAHGIPLAPGETLVSINGVPVNRYAGQQTSYTSRVPAAAAPQKAKSSQPAEPSRYSLAQSKADRMASSGRMAHLGGGFGGGRYEGVGMGSTREAAIRNCCYWGQRTPMDIGAATNGRTWFACVIYR